MFRDHLSNALLALGLVTLLSTGCGSVGTSGAQNGAAAPTTAPVPGNPQTCPYAPPTGVTEKSRTETGIGGIPYGGVRYNFRYEVVWIEDNGQQGIYFQLADGTASTPVTVPSTWDTYVGGGAWLIQVPSTHPVASVMGGTVPVVLGGLQFENTPQTGRDGAEIRIGMVNCQAVVAGVFELPNWPDPALYVARSPVFDCPGRTYLIESFDAGANVYRARDLAYDPATAQYVRGANQTLMKSTDTDSPEC